VVRAVDWAGGNGRGRGPRADDGERDTADGARREDGKSWPQPRIAAHHDNDQAQREHDRTQPEDGKSWQQARIAARIAEDIRVKGRSPADALAGIADIVRYTRQYLPEDYSAAVRADIERTWREGHTEVAVRNYWTCDTWKGISTSWAERDTGQLFEVQFHTPQSAAARELTYPGYLRLRDPATPDDARAEIMAFIRRAYAGEPTAQAPPAERARARRRQAELDRLARERATSFLAPPVPGADGHRVSYYAVVDRLSSAESPAGVLRRVQKGQAGQRDEAFGRDLRWRHTFLIYSWERGNLDNSLLEISADRAMRLTDRIRREVTRP
jgi:hypothetical protein